MSHPDQEETVEIAPSALEQIQLVVYLMAGFAFADVGVKGLFYSDQFNRLVEKANNNPLEPGFTIEMLRNAGLPDTVIAVSFLGVASFLAFSNLERKAFVTSHMVKRVFQRVNQVLRGKSEGN